MRRILLIASLCLSVGASLGQKKILDHTVYDQWKSVRNTTVSDDGNWVSYQIQPHRGDGFLYWYNANTGKLDSIARGKNPKFSGDGKYLIAEIDPGYDTLRKLELEGVKKDKWVKDSLLIVWLGQDTIRKVENLASYHVNEANAWMTYLSTENLEAPKEKKKRFRLFKKKKKEEPKATSKGKKLSIYNPITGEEKIVGDVSSYDFSRNGSFLIYTKTFTKEGVDSSYIYLFDLNKQEEISKTPAFTELGNFSLDYEGNNLAFLASRDTVKKNKVFDLYEWQLNTLSLSKILDTNTVVLEGKTVSNFKRPFYSRDGKKLYFGIAEIPEQEAEDTLLAKEKATLDLWHYKDKRLQPQQLLAKRSEQFSTDLVVCHKTNGNTFSLLINDTLRVYPINHANGPFAIGISNEKYEGSYNWEYPWPSDYYAVDINTGKTKLIGLAVASDAMLSPMGKYFTFLKDENLYIKNVEDNTVSCITCEAEQTNWLYDMNGMPADANSQGVYGFTKGEKQVLLNSEFDVWSYDIAKEELNRLTQGKEQNFKYRLSKWERDSVYYAADNVYIKSFDKVSKAEGILSISSLTEVAELTSLYRTNHSIYSVERAEDAKQTVVYREMSVKDYPDVKITKDNFKTNEQISIANPQQSEYNWATVEQVNWESYAGDSLTGLLYKPENYDSTKNYPLLVYYYELYSDELHNHYAPKPTASIIFATEYASAGYLVFFPDIRYEEGHPAQSAYDCIMSGTDKVLDLYPNIDSTRMGLQGQSWGGYQTAQLITMTDRYAAAMAGAPVSNMFSAYGGIRWGSGLNRQFQYEKTQSRIGKTIWEAPELYVENSPLFHLPNVETPVLIMHNDNDGAVPWYQGIEMFVGLKRLGKPVWMLNYNGDGHNLMENANRVDLSIRMRQFFDYYLLEAPAPRWLKEGIPALDKGEDYKLELIEE